MPVGNHCCDCVFASFTQNEHTGRWQGACSRGYTLCDPHVHESPDNHFVEDVAKLVPVVDPTGKEYLRTSNVCDRFLRPQSQAGR